MLFLSFIFVGREKQTTSKSRHKKQSKTFHNILPFLQNTSQAFFKDKKTAIFQAVFKGFKFMPRYLESESKFSISEVFSEHKLQSETKLPSIVFMFAMETSNCAVITAKSLL